VAAIFNRATQQTGPLAFFEKAYSTAYYRPTPKRGALLPWQVHERGTVYRQLSAQHPNPPVLSKKNLNRSFLDCHFVHDNVYIDCVQGYGNSSYRMLHQVVEITLHYITYVQTSNVYRLIIQDVDSGADSIGHGRLMLPTFTNVWARGHHK